MKSKKLSYFHLLFLIIHLIMLMLNIFDQGISKALIGQVKFMSLWAVNSTFAYFVVKTFGLGSFKLRNDLMSLILCINSMVFVSYWGFMHRVKPSYTRIFVFRLYSDHILPFVFSLIEFARIRHRFYSHQLVQLLKYIISYLTLNLIWTWFSGKPVYDIVTWKNTFSYVFAIGNFTFLIILHFVWKNLSKLKLSLQGEGTKHE